MERNVILLLVTLLVCFHAEAQSDYSPAVFVMEKDTAKAAVPPASELPYRVECELEGREIIGRPEPLRDMPVLSGDVVVEIKVNRYGEVSLVTLLDKGTTLIDRDLIDDVCDDAMNTLFNESATAPVFQMGRMRYHFDIPVADRDTVYVRVGDVPFREAAPAGEFSGGGSDEEEAPRRIEIPEEEHLTFKKVPIGGPLTGFMNALRGGGLTYRGIKDGVGLMEGTFAGIANTRVFAFSLNDETYKVVVDFPGQDTWASMKKQYLYFKRSYTSKYFSTPRSVEKFPPYIPEGSGREHNAFREEAAVYSSTFSVPKGTIVISVQPGTSGEGKFFLRIEYIDEKNSSRNEQEALDDI